MHSNGAMDYHFLSCLPIIILIIGAVITKKIIAMLFIANAVAAIMLYKEYCLNGFIQLIYDSLTAPNFQFLLLLVLGIGALIKVFQESNVIMDLNSFMSKYATNQKKTLALTSLMSILLFIDDYLSIMVTSATMRDLTDKHRIPREHLAYTVNSMGASICVLIPFSSWASYTVGCMMQFNLKWIDYVFSIPYMFCPIIVVTISLLVTLGIVPKVGYLGKAYNNVSNSYQNYFINRKEVNNEVKGCHAVINFAFPITALIVVMFLSKNIIYGLLIAIICQGIIYMCNKKMSFNQYAKAILTGFSSMTWLNVSIVLGCMLLEACNKLGVIDFLIAIIDNSLPTMMIPMVIFTSVSFIAWAVRNFWILILLTMPMFIPLAVSTGINVSVVIGAIMSGVSFGSLFCIYSDAVFLTADGTGIDNMTQIKTLYPYALTAFCLATVLYMLIGLF